MQTLESETHFNFQLSSKVINRKLDSDHNFQAVNKNIRRRYEGLPHPPNAVAYTEGDSKIDAELFNTFFPVVSSDRSTSKSLDSEESTQGVQVQKSQAMDKMYEFSTKQRKGKLSLGPPRKPRSSKPDAYKAAKEAQIAVLTKPSALAIPRHKRQLKLHNSVMECSIHQETVKTSEMRDGMELSLRRISLTPNRKSLAGPATNSTKLSSPLISRQLHSEVSPKTKIQGLLTNRFMGKKPYRNMHSRCANKTTVKKELILRQSTQTT